MGPEQRVIIRGPTTRAALSVQFSRLYASLDIEGKSFHCLRHGAITRRAKQGKWKIARICLSILLGRILLLTMLPPRPDYP